MKVIIIILIDFLFLFSSWYELQMLQQNGYNNKKRFKKYLEKDYRDKASAYFLKYFFAITVIILNQSTWFMFLFVVSILTVLIINAFYTWKSYNEKLPLKYTKRMTRIMILDYLFLLILQLLYARLSLNVFVGFCMMYIALNGHILIFITWLLSPIEKMVYNHYKNKALEKLDSMPSLNVIGITGSFGKTSTKNILDSILKTKYKGFITPASYNTPNGTIITINNQETIFNDYFVSEMGARKEGEIKELCDLVHPKYGIITSIGPAHLETFGSLENICSTKFELVESLPEDGIAILNKDDKFQKSYKIKNNCRVIWIGINNKADVIAKNIKINNTGMSFDIVLKDGEKIKANTILLGDKNIYNILASAALAYELGVDPVLIERGISNIQAIEHRLELKKINNVTILDDAYNSNPEGAKMACDVLGMMKGKHIVITPGMVEMGEEESNLNEKFGKDLAKVSDLVCLVGEKQTKPIYQGLIKAKFNKDNIKIFNSFKEAYNYVMNSYSKEKITLLIENDLPDSYMEAKK